MMKAKCCRAALLLLTSCFLFVSSSAQNTQPLPQDSLQQAHPAGTQDEHAAETSLWESVRDGWEAHGYKSYLAQYPNGRFESEARTRLTSLLGETYVSLFTKRVQVNRKWADVERQLQRRAEIIPFLVEVLDLEGEQELGLFGPMAGARSRMLNALNDVGSGEFDWKSPKKKRAVIDASDDLAETIRKFYVHLEGNPQFRSDEKFNKLLDELAGTENRIAVARRDYNIVAREYNVTRRQGQASVVADTHGFADEPLFEIVEGVRVIEPRVGVNSRAFWLVLRPGAGRVTPMHRLGGWYPETLVHGLAKLSDGCVLTSPELGIGVSGRLTNQSSRPHQ